MVYIEDNFAQPQQDADLHKPESQKQRRLLPTFRFTMFRWFFYGGVCAVLVYGAIAWFAYGQVKDILGDF